MAQKKLEGSPRERLLAAANELFYEEGVNTVGIDRVIERAGVAKASLYSTFGSKDDLVCAYLDARHERRKRRITERIAQHENPRDQILAIFELLAETFAEPSFRGCAFINASAEGPRASPKRAVSDAARAWMRGLFTDLAREFGASDPARFGRQLMLLYDGAIVAASMGDGSTSAADARAVAELLLDAEAHAERRRSVGKAPPARRRPRVS